MFKGRQFDQSVILLCVRWYLAYNLSLRDLEEMMAERGIAVDHTTIDRWTVRFSPLLLERFNRRKRMVTGKWHLDETYIQVRGRWMYLYRAVDSVGDTVDSGSASVGICPRPSVSPERRCRKRQQADPSLHARRYRSGRGAAAGTGSARPTSQRPAKKVPRLQNAGRGLHGAFARRRLTPYPHNRHDALGVDSPKKTAK
jgi:hypothetical protein